MRIKTNGRWHVTITYNVPGVAPEFYDLEELEQLQDIVERGRDWNDIALIETRLVRSGYRS